jgi:hypothetical protein
MSATPTKAQKVAWNPSLERLYESWHRRVSPRPSTAIA